MNTSQIVLCAVFRFSSLYPSAFLLILTFQFIFLPVFCCWEFSLFHIYFAVRYTFSAEFAVWFDLVHFPDDLRIFQNLLANLLSSSLNFTNFHAFFSGSLLNSFEFPFQLLLFFCEFYGFAILPILPIFADFAIFAIFADFCRFCQFRQSPRLSN